MTQQRAFALFGLVLVAVFLFFLMGLWIGKTHLSAGDARIDELAEQPLEDVQPLLDFYGEFAESETESAPPEQPPEARTEEAPPSTVPEPPPASDPESPPVVREAERPPAPAPATEAETRQGGDYTIQVGAYSVEREAREMLGRLLANDFAARIQSPQPGGRDAYYRVRVGRFGSAAEARTMEAELKEKGFSTFVTRVE